MIQPPLYFEQIHQRAAQRWVQLEGDPELAGPWHQLFKQVQSPRHVLSELLQNADDAGATEASVRIEDGYFIFTHNGEDFTEEHFASLCRFGYSNKRALHTIGFRGIGFKSIFSLGDTVELYTPTLSVAFDRQRFTEPRWLASSLVADGRTQIRVAIGDEHRQREVEKNLQEWLKSPVSLLFFRHIRRLRIGERDVHWGDLGPGPVPETEWMALHEDPDQAFLVVRSEAEPFPPEALAEIRQERLLGTDQDMDFPPCKVEIVLGAPGRLYVVLPTGVETPLPFACNAPFIQDPARVKIKDPETSPTNRWLLERVGALAASATLQWLGQTATSLAERSGAYFLLPDVDREDTSLEGTCATAVEVAFEAAIEDEAFILTDAGDLQPIVPEELFEVWPAEQVAALLDSEHRPALSRQVSDGNRQRLLHWGFVDEISRDDVLKILQEKRLPQPNTWGRLLRLWAYVAPRITGHWNYLIRDRVRIVPVRGADVLYAASEVVRLGEGRLLQSEADWEFLAEHLRVLNQRWLRFLAEQRRNAEEHGDEGLREKVEAAFAALRDIGLEEASDVSKVVERVAQEFFCRDPVTIAACVQFTQMAAKLGASVGDAFRFVTRDGRLRAPDHIVLFDPDGTLEGLFPETWCSAHLLHQEYSNSFASCTPDELSRWISSGRAGLHAFAPLVKEWSYVRGKRRVEAELRRRGFAGMATYHYVTDEFRIEDWDFDKSHWRHWAALAEEDSRLWGRLGERILAQPEAFWSRAKSARALQAATTGNTRAIVSEPLLPAWVLKLRDLPCLPDTRGFYRKPGDLLRRTPETESLIDVEPFVDGRLDVEATRPLLELLGVRDTPTGPDRLLDCLRALAMADEPPVHEVEKWYRRLDQMVDTCSTMDLANIRGAFRDERIILTEEGAWSVASGVFLSADEEDVPGAAIIRASVRDLALWRKIGVAERPTTDLAIQWLNALPSGDVLSPDDARRVRALLGRHAARIWHECGHWLNLAGEWVSTGTLGYAITMQSLVPWSHLHQWVKQKTADLQRLTVEVTETPPFSDLPPLAGHIEDRFHRDPLVRGRSESKPWLSRLGAELHRIQLDDEADTARVRALAADLRETVWETTTEIEIIPYIDGTPAGTPRRAEAVWLDRVLYAEDRPCARLARAVSQELGRAFRRPDIADAIKLCFDRSPEFVAEYVEENFTLIPREALVDGALPTEPPSTAAVDESASTSGDETPVDRVAVEANGNATAESLEESLFEAAPALNIEEIRAELDELDDRPRKVSPAPKPARANIIERFARVQGFRKDGSDRFSHADGSWIAKANGGRFPWERRTATGELVRYYWPKEHCLEREPLQLEADVWGLVDKFPDTYALILSNPEGDPLEVPGTRLQAMCNAGELTLYPATYRLVYSDDQ
jgi:hypothetical protein